MESRSTLDLCLGCISSMHGELFPPWQLTRSNMMTLIWEFKAQSVDRTDALCRPALKTNPVRKWQLRSLKYTCSLPCSLTEQSFSQTWPAPGRDTWTMLRHALRPRLTEGLKRRAGDDPFVPSFFLRLPIGQYGPVSQLSCDPFVPYAAVNETSVPATSGDHSAPMDTEETGRDATSVSSNTTEVDSAQKGPLRLMGQRPSPENSPMISWQQFLCFPDEWPLAKLDLILQNTDKYYMSWRRFLFVHELLRTLDEKAAVAAARANTTSLVEHLVEFLSEWIVTFVEPARITKVRDSELLFLHEKD